MTNQALHDFEELHKISREVKIFQGISSLLIWDQETHMPKDAANIRASQLEALAKLIHKARTSPKFSKALSRLIDLSTGEIKQKGLDPAREQAVILFRKDYLKEKALPTSFVEKFAKLTSITSEAWKIAKEKSDFSLFAPHLENILKLVRKKAHYLGYKEHPYDALIDNFEPGMTVSKLKNIFDPLKKEIATLLKEIKKLPVIDDSFLEGSVPMNNQLEFAELMMEQIGYKKDRGRLDLSTHPFSSAAHPTDSRITTYIHPKSFTSTIFSTLHETGHALYEIGLPEEYYGTPLGEDLSFGVHESQSQWWETFIGQSKPFWTHFLPLLKKHIPIKASVDEFVRAVQKVSPSFIRVSADEVTYSLHIILRFELEIALIEGTLKVNDLPKAWGDKMEELLGIRPPNDAEGCLQDIHWSWGEFGYFPSYALGNIYAANLLVGFERDHPEWQTRVAKGEFEFITNWLRHHIHRHGRRFSVSELIENASKVPLSSEPFINYLKKKYLISTGK